MKRLLRALVLLSCCFAGYDANAQDKFSVQLLLVGGSDPVIKRDPSPAAWSNILWEKAASTR